MIRTLPISCGFSSIIMQPQLRTPWSWYSIFFDPFCASTTHLTHTQTLDILIKTARLTLFLDFHPLVKLFIFSVDDFSEIFTRGDYGQSPLNDHPNCTWVITITPPSAEQTFYAKELEVLNLLTPLGIVFLQVLDRGR